MKNFTMQDFDSMELDWMAHAVLIIVLLSVSVGVYHGVQSIAALSGPMAYILPVAVSAVAGGMIFAIWHWLLRYVPVMRAPWNLFGIGLGVVLSIAAVYTTATFFVSAVVGDRAVRDHMMETLNQYELALNNAYANFKSEQAIITKLNESQAAARSLVAAEAARGGCGPNCRELESVADSFSRAARTGSQSQAAGDLAFEQGQEALTAVRGALSAGISPAEAQSVFSDAKAAVTGAVAALESNSVAQLSYNVGSVSAEIDGSYEVSELTAGIRETADKVAAGRRSTEVPTYSAMNQYEAVTSDVGKYGLLWAFAVFLELFPLIILIARTVIFQNHARAEDNIDREAVLAFRQPAE